MSSPDHKRGHHGGSGHHGSGQRDDHHHGRGQGGRHGEHHSSDAAEGNAFEEAQALAKAAGVKHHHFVNRGLDEEHDIARGSFPHHVTEASSFPGMAAAGVVTPTTSTEAVKRPPVKPYESDPNSPIEVGIRQGTHVIGRLSLARWTNAVAFVKNPHVLPWDVFIGGIDNRGAALPGDIVVVQLKPQSEWKPSTREVNDGSNHVPAFHPRGDHQKARVGDADDGGNEDEAEQVSRLQDGRVVEHVIRDDGSKRKPADDAERLTKELGGKTAFDWPANLQPEGHIVAVLERRFDPIQCCRYFQSSHPGPSQQSSPTQITNDRWYRFKSYSDDFPIVAVYGRDIPTHFREDITQFLFLVQVNTEPAVKFADGKFPIGVVKLSLGQTGTVDAESAAISYSFKVKDAPFSEEVEACVMQHFDIPSAAELAEMGRRDLREEEFVCTIDPATARDLDDAISIAPTPGGYRVGVHIADVSFFVPAGSALDYEAQQRATSTYYVDRVIPMLPRKLCEDYCSLNAGVDKFAFSGIWHFDRAGNVQSEWFGQSVIRNRCRMAYEDAQRIIDGDLSGDSLNFVNEDEPRETLVKKVVLAIQQMQELALILRERRFERGALSLNKGKLKFVFEDFNSKLAPKAVTQERSRAANFLVEEFMLHANCRVGEKVVQFLPDGALLRKHDPPVKKKLKAFIEAAGKFGFKISGSGSKALRDSLAEYNDHPDIDSLRFMATICMSLAKYTASEADKKVSVAHFALAAPIYTHFTSPIRRYADLVIHRQLLLALDIERELKRRGVSGVGASAHADTVDVHALSHGEYYLHPSDVANIAEHCNERKEAAKKAGDASSNLFLCLFIRAIAEKSKVEPGMPSKLVLRCIVVRITDAQFTLYIPDVAITYEVHHNTTMQRWAGENSVEEDLTGFTVNWGTHPTSGEVITEKMTLFSQALVTLDAVVRGHMELQATVHPPWERDPARVTSLQFEL